MISHTTELQLERTVIDGIRFQYANGENPSPHTLSVVHTAYTRHYSNPSLLHFHVSFYGEAKCDLTCLHLYSEVLDFETTHRVDL